MVKKSMKTFRKGIVHTNQGTQCCLIKLRVETALFNFFILLVVSFWNAKTVFNKLVMGGGNLCLKCVLLH